MPILLAGLGAMLAAAGCDITIPTEAPILDTRWVIPAEDTRFSVAELLPPEVVLTADTSAFVVSFDSVTFSETLDNLCAPCALANGFTVPKPSFKDSLESTISFPTDVSYVEVLTGDVVVELTNGLNFDPLRPSVDSIGSIVITITDTADGDTLSSLVLDGSTTALPAGGSLMQTLTLSPTVVQGGLTAKAVVDSPLGDSVTMNSSLPFSVKATPQNIQVGSISVDVSSQTFNLDPVDLDVEDIDPDIYERVTAGAFVLAVTNPFGVAASFNLSISGPTIATIAKAAVVTSSGTSTVTIGFTGAELQSFLGQPGVVLTGGGSVGAGGGVVTVSPSDELLLSANLDVTLRIGS